jgi:hypothetical protein
VPADQHGIHWREKRDRVVEWIKIQKCSIAFIQETHLDENFQKINRNINSIHNYNLTPSLKIYIECLTIHDNTFSNIYIVYLHIFSSMFYNP